MGDGQGIRRPESTRTGLRGGALRGALTGATALAALLAIAPAAFAGPGKVTVADRVGADAGGHVKLFANDDFKVTGECEDNGGGDFTANTFLKARRDNLAYSAYGPAAGVDDFDVDFDRADGKIDFTASDATGTAPDFEEAEYYEFYAEGEGGEVLRGHVATSVHLKGSDCNFAGVFFGASKSGPLHAVDRIKADAGENVTLYANKDFKVTGTCQDNGGGDLTANTFISAKRAKVLAYSTSLDQAAINFGPGDGPFDFVDSNYDIDGAAPGFRSWSYYQDFYAQGRRGRVLQGRVGTGVHMKGADCTFSGTFVGPKSGGALHVVNTLKAKAGKRVTLYENKDFKVTGRCEDNGGGDLTANTLLSAKRKNLMYYAYDDGVDTDFDPGDEPADFTSEDASGTSPDFMSVDQYTDFHGEGRGGEVLAGRVATGVHIEGADCTFSGFFSG